MSSNVRYICSDTRYIYAHASKSSDEVSYYTLQSTGDKEFKSILCEWIQFQLCKDKDCSFSLRLRLLKYSPLGDKSRFALRALFCQSSVTLDTIGWIPPVRIMATPAAVYTVNREISRNSLTEPGPWQTSWLRPFRCSAYFDKSSGARMSAVDSSAGELHRGHLSTNGWTRPLWKGKTLLLLLRRSHTHTHRPTDPLTARTDH